MSQIVISSLPSAWSNLVKLLANICGKNIGCNLDVYKPISIVLTAKFDLIFDKELNEESSEESNEESNEEANEESNEAQL